MTLPPEERKRRQREGAAKALANRWRKVREARDAAAHTAPPAPAPQQGAPSDTAEGDAGVKNGPGLNGPLNWTDELKKRQADRALVAVERDRIELETLKRERIPRAEVREFIRAMRAALLKELASLPSVADALTDPRAGQVEAMRASLSTWIAKARDRIARVEL